MKKRKIIYSLVLGGFIFIFVLAALIACAANQKTKVIFLNVGQGDAILIEEGSNQILIDGGPDGKTILEKLGKYIPFWDREIETVIATHPDADHITGLAQVMENYKVGEVIDNGVASDSGIYKKFKEIIAGKNIDELEGKARMSITTASADLKIVYPFGDQDKNNPKDTNISSLVAKLSAGEKNFLFTGDLTTDGESDLIQSGENLSADILKVGHHGSKYSTSADFLAKIKPKQAIISVGKNNYGHPAQEILDRLCSNKVEILRTDEKGDIEYDL